MTPPPFNNILSEADAIDAKIAAWKIRLEHSESVLPHYERMRLVTLVDEGQKLSTAIRVHCSQYSQGYSQ